MLIINFEGREAKGLSNGRYDETFAGEDNHSLAISKVSLPVIPANVYTQLRKGSFS